MQRFLHPLAFFATILLMIGLLVTLSVNGLSNALVCADGCSSSVADLRVRLALLFLGPGMLLSIAAWNIALTTLTLRQAWRACGAILIVPLVVWVTLLNAASIIPTIGISGLADAHLRGLLVALESGALTLWGLMCVLFVLPLPQKAAMPAQQS